MKKPNQKSLNRYMTRIEAAEKWRDGGYRDKWERWYKRYRNHVDPLYDEKGKLIADRSNISIPYSFTQVETILPRLVESLFAARPYVAVKGKPKDIQEFRMYAHMEQKPWEIAAQKNEQLLDYQQNVVFDIQDKFHGGLKTMCIYGTTVGYVGWKLDEKPVVRKETVPVEVDGIQVTDIDPSTGEEIPLTEFKPFQTTETVYDDPELCFIDLGLFYVDPHSEDIDGARYCGHVEYHTKSYIQSMHDKGIWFVDWKKVPKDGGKRNEARDRRMGSIGLPTTNSFDADDVNEDHLYEIHHYWEDDRWVIIINRGYVAFDSENPYWHKKKPYVKDVYCKVPGEFYGISIIEMIEDLQDELNTERNQRIDNRSRALRRFYTQRRGASISPSDFTMRNGGRVLVDNHDDIKEWTHQPLGGDTFTQESIIKKDMQDTTGAQDVVMGTSGTSETATTTMSKDNNASMRFKLVISSVEKRLLVRVSTLMIQLNQQYIDAPRLLETGVNGEEQLLEVTPEEIQGQFRLTAMGSSVEPMANKEAFKQRMVELYQIAANDPFYQQYPQYRKALLQKVFESFDIKDVENLLPTDEEISGMMQQEVISQFVSTLPPELQQIMSQGMSGANTAPMQEQGLQLVRG